MKRFKFSLEAVATLRRHTEQLALDRFARASLDHRQALQTLDQMQKELAAALTNRPTHQSQTAVTYAQAQAWQLVLRQRVQSQNERVSTTLRALDEANRVLTQARQQREAVEKVRTSRIARHESDLRRWEQKILDELAQNQSLAQGLLNSTGL